MSDLSHMTTAIKRCEAVANSDGLESAPTTAKAATEQPKGEQQGLDPSAPFHPIADVFPLIEGDEFEALVADIKSGKLHEAITKYENKILDGRNRYRACLKAGVAPQFKEYDGDDPIGYVISKNVCRRHLDKGQLEIAAAKLATLPQGRPAKSGQLAGILTQAQAAQLLNISERNVRRAAGVIKDGVPELQRAVMSGEVSVSAAADIATTKPDRQRSILARGPIGVRKAVKEIRVRDAAKKRRDLDAKRGSAEPEAGTTPASFRTTAEEAEKQREHAASIGHAIDPHDLIVAPGSKSANARPSEYAIVRIPNSHPKREVLKQTIMELRDKYNTQIVFKTFPNEQHDQDDDAGDLNDEADHAE